jgi:hypothetical protein
LLRILSIILSVILSIRLSISYFNVSNFLTAEYSLYLLDDEFCRIWYDYATSAACVEISRVVLQVIVTLLDLCL